MHVPRLSLSYALPVLLLLLAGCGGGGGGGASSPSQPEALPSDPPPSPPNILLVIADDYGLDAAALDPLQPVYDVGDPTNDPQMPTLAALAAEGVCFDNAWAMPTCSPTRATILTGTYPYQHGVMAPTTANANTLDLNAWTLPKALRDSRADYDLASFGKWHVSAGADDPNTAGWPHFAGLLSGAVGDYYAWSRTENGVTNPSSTYATTAQVNDALAWLSTRGDKPWLLWLAFNGPHTPFHEPPAALHQQGSLGPYVSGDAQPWFRAMCEAVDTEFGRLKQSLIDSGEWDDTVVIFVGDNGTAAQVSDDVYGRGRAKASLLAGGIHVPMIIAGPGVQGANRRISELVSVVDLFSTILDLAGLDPEAERARQAPSVTLDSRSLRPLLEGGTDAIHDTIQAARFSSTPDVDGHAIRSMTHKLILYDDGAVALFDLTTDPLEETDLYEDGIGPAAGHEPAYVALRDALRARLDEPTLGP